MMEEKIEYIYGVHCGDDNCYACATQRYNCPWLDSKDKERDEEKKRESEK